MRDYPIRERGLAKQTFVQIAASCTLGSVSPFSASSSDGRFNPPNARLPRHLIEKNEASEP
jgi:hypothetical protein